MSSSKQEGSGVEFLTPRTEKPTEDTETQPIVSSISPEPGALSTHFRSKKIHPVLVFGNVGAGKTMVLLSLLNFGADNAPQIGVFLGENAFPEFYPNAPDRIDYAVSFYNDGLTRFRDGILPEKTDSKMPFFVPIDVIFTNKLGYDWSFKLAFLEGQGEWYERDQNKTFRYQPFKEEIIEILRFYTKPISVIFVLPSEVPGNENELRKSHDCLANCIEEYRRHRDKRHRYGDNLLLLLSKWDSTYPPSDASGQFAAADADKVVEKAAYRQVWEKFTALEGLAIGAKSLTPYCAAEVAGTQIVESTPATKAVLEKFNKTLWNWLFMNLTGVPTGGEEITYSTFFTEVVPSEARSGYNGLLRRLLGARRLNS